MKDILSSLARHETSRLGLAAYRLVRPDASISAGFSSLRDRLHKIETVFDFSEQAREILFFLRGETGQDLLLPLPKERNELFVERTALAREAQHELASVILVFDPFHKLPIHQRRDGAADSRLVR